MKCNQSYFLVVNYTLFGRKLSFDGLIIKLHFFLLPKIACDSKQPFWFLRAIFYVFILKFHPVKVHIRIKPYSKTWWDLLQHRSTASNCGTSKFWKAALSELFTFYYILLLLLLLLLKISSLFFFSCLFLPEISSPPASLTISTCWFTLVIDRTFFIVFL